ncbi:UDP-N-acetylmuramate dehydrogenase [bacterium]|nr:UDP-N-acetylmuramate dehydrogenase [bacterium]
MLEIKENLSLKSYNTFGLDVKASEVYFLTNIAQLSDIPQREEALILGGGSNVLLTSDLHRPVIINQLKGIEVLSQEADFIELRVASGENWHELVMYCVEHGYGGIENLSLIPGSVGAAPMQNIGAYGVEIQNVLQNVTAIRLSDLKERTFSAEECEFGYRHSIFKSRLKGQYLITGITLRLTKNHHTLNTSYGAIQEVLARKGITEASIKDISEAVIEIRQSKLPDPKELGNTGSFFKNPVIKKAHFDRLKSQYPEIKSYPVDDDHVKVPAGWLIESRGWKGKVVGNTGSHKQQALVLVNYGKATGKEVKELSEAIKADIASTYGIELETEVNIIEA